MTLEQLIHNEISVPLSYGWTSDYRDVMARLFRTRSKEEQLIVCIEGAAIFSIVGGKIGNFTSCDPSIVSVISNIIAKNPATDNKCFVILGNVKVTPLVKVFYDDTFNYLREDTVTNSNLITNTDDISRNLGAEEYDINADEKPSDFKSRIIVVGHDSEMPENMNSAAFYLGCVDTKQQKEKPALSGLNSIEKEYMNQMMETLSVNEDNVQVIASLRKGIFSGSKVIKDISIVEDVKDIGGYDIVKKYYDTRKKYIKAEKGIIKIKGDLFVGPPGTGKSRILTAIPSLLGIPGFELDINAALGSLQGQSEQAFREAIAKAKKLAPCVLLLDEVEKMLSGVGEGEVAGNEVAMKLLGILLSAMAENNGIYWVASANKIAHIQASHPELLRKGRFDNIWYVPLPKVKVRAKILGIHSRINGLDLKNVDVDEIVKRMEDWSGAEIAHICREVNVENIANGTTGVNTERFNNHIDKIKGISKDAKASKELDTWSKDNALAVD
jgi:SpoVK/Ycf46/Vps4 family AAA+-type ATPase